MKKHVQETDKSAGEKVDIREKHAALKKVYKDVKEGYQSLKKMTEEQRPQQPKQRNFVDVRVRELWKMAQQANMTEDELSSFKVCFTSSQLHTYVHIYIQGVPEKVIPYEKFDISGVVVTFVAKFTAFIEEDSGHISCKFLCVIWLHSKIITIYNYLNLNVHFSK